MAGDSECHVGSVASVIRNMHVQGGLGLVKVVMCLGNGTYLGDPEEYEIMTHIHTREEVEYLTVTHTRTL